MSLAANNCGGYCSFNSIRWLVLVLPWMGCIGEESLPYFCSCCFLHCTPTNWTPWPGYPPSCPCFKSPSLPPLENSAWFCHCYIFQWHVIAGYPLMFSDLYTPWCREVLWERRALPRNATQWLRPGLKPRPLDPESIVLTIRSPSLDKKHIITAK